jgi:glycosyltransferase involved in cell wall biosynthesis
MNILVAQLGARRHYAVPRALYHAGLLERLITDACADIPPWRWLNACLPRAGRTSGLRRMLGRSVADVPQELIQGFPLFALSARWDRRKGELQTDRWARRNAAFCQRVARRGFGHANAVYAFNGAALEIFQAARARGLRTVLDQTAAPWRWNARLLREERTRWPGWEDQPAEIDESGRLSDREEAEWALADRIICGSEFAAAALAEAGGPRARCVVVSYPAQQIPIATDARRGRAPGVDRPLRILFLGTLQLRKGVQYLLQAKRLLRGENVTFRLVGPSQLADPVMRTLRQELEVIGPVPRSEVAAHYAWADVFVLPTLSEGSANVVYEAMAVGLPVITTPNAGSIIRDGESGLLVPARDAERLAASIVRLLDDQNLREQLGEKSRWFLERTDAHIYALQLASATA